MTRGQTKLADALRSLEAAKQDLARQVDLLAAREAQVAKMVAQFEEDKEVDVTEALSKQAEEHVLAMKTLVAEHDLALKAAHDVRSSSMLVQL